MFQTAILYLLTCNRVFRMQYKLLLVLYTDNAKWQFIDSTNNFLESISYIFDIEFLLVLVNFELENCNFCYTFQVTCFYLVFSSRCIILARNKKKYIGLDFSECMTLCNCTITYLYNVLWLLLNVINHLMDNRPKLQYLWMSN